MTVYRLDPLEDRRWPGLVACHPGASVFHTRGWLSALKRTYGYLPIAFTGCRPDEELRSAIVFCEIRSWLTGTRLVSLPFSDHCDPLLNDTGELETSLRYLDREKNESGWRYVELRPLNGPQLPPAGFVVFERYFLHSLELRPELDTIFGTFHKSSVRQRILRAQREGVTCEEGSGGPLLRQFYRLHVQTRRRHGLPPQPFQWFRNLSECFGEGMTVRIAHHRGKAIASIITLRHRDTTVYKYGASDTSGHPVGGIHILLWKAIQDAAVGGCVSLDFGRTDLSDSGLSGFKERWGAKRTPLCYWRCAVSAGADSARDWVAKRGVRAARRVPAPLQIAAGRVFYRHLG